MTPRIFVTGTDTGVGKTVVSALLTKAVDGCYWKPIQAGLDGPTDTELAQRWSGLPRSRFLPEAYRLRLAASPHLAASAENTQINLDRLQVPAVRRPLIIEGAGGVLVPLNRSQLMIDLIERASASVVVVARTTLGTINHTLLTLQALRQRRLLVMGVIVNGPENLENERAIACYGRTHVLAWLEPVAEITPQTLADAYHERRCFGLNSDYFHLTHGLPVAASR